MKILQTLLLTLVITSSLIEFEVLCHKQGVSVSTTISIGEDKNAAKALAPTAQDKSGYLGLSIVNNKVVEVFPDSPSAKARHQRQNNLWADSSCNCRQAYRCKRNEHRCDLRTWR